MSEWTRANHADLPEGPSPAAAGEAFRFDRPAERGLAPRAYGEGTLPGPEAREAVADRLRDALLANYEPSEELTRMPEER